MEQLIQHIIAHPIVPVFYDDDLARCIATLEASYKGGIRVFEFVHRGVNAIENFEALLAHKKVHFPALSLGIGTIKTAELAKKYVALGADFIVSPIVNPAIAEETLAKGKLWIPGCLTPTEIALAESLGAPLVKIFPGDLVGPGFVKSIKPLFPNTKFMITGGVEVDESNVKNWLSAGASALGLGSKLFQNTETADGSGELADRCEKLLSWTKK